MTGKQPEDDKKSEYDEKVAKLDWIIRPCDFYKDEFKECKSIRGRFNQYFIYGEYLDCEPWRNDHNNCKKWNKKQDKQAASELIDREVQRYDKRMKAHNDNDTWTKRDKPPEDWAKPLPEFIQKRNENTYLAIRAKELKEEEEALEKAAANTLSETNSNKNKEFCTIM